MNMQLVLSLVATYGYVVVLLLVMAESAGLPLPGETALLVAGAFAATGKLALPGVVAAAATGAVLGDTAGYWIGRTSGLALLRRHGRWVRFDEQKLARAEDFFTRHGDKTVFFGRFVPVGRIFSAVLAGISRMRYRRFLLWNAAGGLTWASLMGTLGFLFGHQLPLIERLVGQFGLALLVLLALVLVARIIFHNRAAFARVRSWSRPAHSVRHVSAYFSTSLARAAAAARQGLYRRDCRVILVGLIGCAVLGGAGAVIALLT